MNKSILFLSLILLSLTANAGLKDAVIQAGPHRGQSLYSIVTQTVSARATDEAFAFFDRYHGWQRNGLIYPIVQNPNSHVNNFACNYKRGKCAKLIPQLVQQKLLANTRYMMIFDLNQPSTVPRLHIVDLQTGEVASLFATHGKESSCTNDPSRACKFISDRYSEASPLGFFMTGHAVYTHRWLIPLYGLQGPAPASARNDVPSTIVIHGAAYASQQFIKKHGYMGHSSGCPALSYSDLEVWRDRIQDGALFYFYHNSIPATAAPASGVF